MAGAEVPVIDIAPFLGGNEAARRAVAGAIDGACREIGFFTITGHGIPEELIAETRAQAVAFFGQPEAEKLKVERPPQKVSRGYNRFRDRSLSYTLGVAAPPDLQEAYAFGPEAITGEDYDPDDPATAMLAGNLWPERPEGFRDTMLAYYDAMSALGAHMMRIVAMALDVDEDFFADKFDHQSSNSRLIHYPAQDEPPEESQLRAGMHTDYGAVTFVRGDDVPGGLQVKLRHGEWIDVHPVPGSFVCNIADAVMRWTNDRYVSTLHRVVNPPREAARQDRISLVFFHMPNHDAVIRCIPGCAGAGGVEKYPPITFTEHYLGKILKAAHGHTAGGDAHTV